MVYVLRQYASTEDFWDEVNSNLIAFETDKAMGFSNPKICGKVIAFISEEETVKIPEGVTSIGRSFLIPEQWGGWFTPVNTVDIPASVTEIEDGAFECEDEQLEILIRAPKGSFAIKYAIEHDIKYEEL